ncbi:unnamed protein product [Arabidopsis thaliana]|uniref:F-box domain-containing protein n=1 Tax=Arabidopsis thaliana TaxID=3702 RepID=A0A5S9WPR3_ARATH|nr:unnamed protein product [Arabidopsis thaliana]
MAETEKSLQSLDPIHVDMLFEIFLNLPAKSLARFVCVSKLWAKIIRNQDFIRSFSFRSSRENKQHRLLFAFKNQIKGYQENWYFFSKSTHVSTPLYEPNSLVLPDQNINKFEALVGEEPPDFESSTVCHLKKMRYQNPSYVHGLISFLYGEEQIICNPSIGKSINLPTLGSSETIIGSFLGYDPIHAQYKVLCLNKSSLQFCGHQVLTLGAQNCSWRMIQCPTPHYPGTTSVCIDGVLYYSASRGFTMHEPLNLVRFDLRTESLEIASVFPEDFKSSVKPSLINYRGKVVVFSKYFCGDFGLWVLEDAKKQQWSKEQRISIRRGVIGRLPQGLQILGTSDMGEIIFAPNYFKEFVVYFLDRKSNKIRCVELEGNTKYKFRDFCKVFTF